MLPFAAVCWGVRAQRGHNQKKIERACFWPARDHKVDAMKSLIIALGFTGFLIASEVACATARSERLRGVIGGDRARL